MLVTVSVGLFPAEDDDAGIIVGLNMDGAGGAATLDCVWGPW